jgi:hypothetical protein
MPAGTSWRQPLVHFAEVDLQRCAANYTVMYPSQQDLHAVPSVRCAGTRVSVLLRLRLAVSAWSLHICSHAPKPAQRAYV